MSRIAVIPRFALCIPLALACASAHAQQQSLVPSHTAQSQDLFPGVTAAPIGGTPLSRPPYVYALKLLDPARMSAADAAVVSSLHPELAKKAALASFDLDNPGWLYRQIACPALPDFVLLAFRHGSGPDGSSRFVAALARNEERNEDKVWIVSTAAHGLLPFDSVWSKPATYEVFNRMLRQERGLIPLTNAPNWLVISMCYAELSGSHVQVFTAEPLPGPSLDLSRLHANLPQMRIDPDRSASVTFSDAAKPETTVAWTLNFNSRGQITSATHGSERQSRKIALKP